MGRGRSRCVCARVWEKVLKKIRSSSLWSFSTFLFQATEINLFYANSFRAFSFICIPSFVFHLFASWNSLLQVIGFPIFLLCLSSWFKRHSDEVTESAKSGTENCHLHRWKFVFVFLHWTPKKNCSSSCQCMKTKNVGIQRNTEEYNLLVKQWNVFNSLHPM